MALADRDFVDADRPGAGPAGTFELLGHILLVQRLDGLPVELEFLGDIADRRPSAALSHVSGKPFRVERVARQPVDPPGLQRRRLFLRCAQYFLRIDHLDARQLAQDFIQPRLVGGTDDH